MAIKNGLVLSTPKGYTLIELVVVVGLVSILAIGISSAVLINAVTATRTKNTTHLRSVGDYSVNQLKQLIRGARDITLCDSTQNSLTLTSPDGGETLINLELDNEIGRISSNSGVYISPSTANITNFTLDCLPSDSDPTLIQLSFDAALSASTESRESPTLHFRSSITPRSN
jgi:prepilin-type N-terminal cleavage/methylation domain-containing protein